MYTAPIFCNIRNFELGLVLSFMTRRIVKFGKCPPSPHCGRQPTAIQDFGDEEPSELVTELQLTKSTSTETYGHIHFPQPENRGRSDIAHRRSVNALDKLSWRKGPYLEKTGNSSEINIPRLQMQVFGVQGVLMRAKYRKKEKARRQLRPHFVNRFGDSETNILLSFCIAENSATSLLPDSNLQRSDSNNLIYHCR